MDRAPSGILIATIEARTSWKNIDMRSKHQSGQRFTPVQDELVGSLAKRETVMQFCILIGAVGLFHWLELGFELSLLLLLVIGFTLNTANQISCAVGHNIHLAEIRDLLLKQQQTERDRSE